MTPEEHLDRVDELLDQVEKEAAPGGAGLRGGMPIQELLLLAQTHAVTAQAKMTKDQGKK